MIYLDNAATSLQKPKEVEEIDGVIINPWNRTLMLDKNLIRIVRG